MSVLPAEVNVSELYHIVCFPMLMSRWTSVTSGEKFIWPVAWSERESPERSSRDPFGKMTEEVIMDSTIFLRDSTTSIDNMQQGKQMVECQLFL